MTVQCGSVAGLESSWTIVTSHVDLTAAAKECYGEVFGGGFDVLLVACYGGETKARVGCLVLFEMSREKEW